MRIDVEKSALSSHHNSNVFGKFATRKSLIISANLKLDRIISCKYLPKSFWHVPTYLSVWPTRLGDLLEFGQLFKACGNN